MKVRNGGRIISDCKHECAMFVWLQRKERRRERGKETERDREKQIGRNGTEQFWRCKARANKDTLFAAT